MPALIVANNRVAYNVDVSHISFGSQLNQATRNKIPIRKGSVLFKSGDRLSALYVVYSGSIKSYILDSDGGEQITSFHMPGDIIGFDALGSMIYPGFAEAMENSVIFEVPIKMQKGSLQLDSIPLSKITLLMSEELKNSRTTHLMLSKKRAECRLASFILHLSDKFSRRGLSSKSFYLPMTRCDIGNYLGLTMETISRVLTIFKKMGIIDINRRLVTIKSQDELTKLAEV